MNAGKTLFSQLMDCVPWSTFTRIVARYHGDHSVQTFPCTEQYRAMAFAQLTYRESLRDADGRQFVVIAAGGSILLQSPIGDALVAFALPPR